MTRVPNDNNYGLIHVRDAVKSHAPAVQDNLDSCFANAVSSYFDANYNNNTYAGESTGRSLKRFRNYGKTYEIQTLRLLDAPSQFANEVNWQNLDHSTNYYLEVRLNNPDSTFVKNIVWRINWSETHPSGRNDYTWLNFYNVVFGDKYIVFDHDIYNVNGEGLIAYRVQDKPGTFDQPGEYYELSVASNYGSIFYLRLKAKPYANFHPSVRKTINLFNTAKPNGDSVSFVNPNRTFLFPYVQDNAFKFFYPTAISSVPSSNIYIYGYAAAYSEYYIDFTTVGGTLVYRTGPFYNTAGITVVWPYNQQVVAGYYRLRAVTSNGTLIEEIGTILLT